MEAGGRLLTRSKQVTLLRLLAGKGVFFRREQPSAVSSFLLCTDQEEDGLSRADVCQSKFGDSWA